MEKDKINALFLSKCSQIKEFALYRESISHKSFLDKYYVVDECPQRMLDDYSNIKPINSKLLAGKKNIFDYIEVRKSLTQSQTDVLIKLLKNDGDLQIKGFRDENLFYYLSSLFRDLYFLNKNDIVFKGLLESPKEKISDLSKIEIKPYKNFLDFREYTRDDLKAKDIDNTIELTSKINKKFKIEKVEYDLEELYNYENLNKIYKRQMDDLNQEKLKKTNKKTKIFKEVKSTLSRDYVDDEVSQGFLKMYEALEVFKLFDLRKKEFKSFHFCEAPGQFIKATKYYLENKDKVLDWHAQSLNPKKFNEAFDDVYNLIRDNPKRWVFGPDESGDITNDKVVKSYKSYCQGVDLITSDCGIGQKNNFQMTYQDKRMAYINYCQIIAILYNLPKGANFIAKVFLPQSVNYLVSLNYIISKSFSEFYGYKPYLNPTSSEIYLIGKVYNPLPNKIIDYLFEKKKNLDIEFGFISIPQTFLDDYSKKMSILLKNNLEAIKMNIAFYKKKYKFEKTDEIYENNVKFWVKKFQFPKAKFTIF